MYKQGLEQIKDSLYTSISIIGTCVSLNVLMYLYGTQAKSALKVVSVVAIKKIETETTTRNTQGKIFSEFEERESIHPTHKSWTPPSLMVKGSS